MTLEINSLHDFLAFFRDLAIYWECHSMMLVPLLYIWAGSQLQCLHSSPWYRWPSWGRSPGSTTHKPLSRPANANVLMIIPKIKNISTNKVFFKEQKKNFRSLKNNVPAMEISKRLLFIENGKAIGKNHTFLKCSS